MKKSNLDLAKELTFLEKKTQQMIKESLITKGQMDLFCGLFTTKEALEEINKLFEKQMLLFTK